MIEAGSEAEDDSFRGSDLHACSIFRGVSVNVVWGGFTRPVTRYFKAGWVEWEGGMGNEQECLAGRRGKAHVPPNHVD